MERIPIPTIGKFLSEEFMEPYHLSAYKLAKLIKVPVSRIQDILHGRRKMSIDTSMRLGRLFGLDDLFFFRLQLDIDYRNAKAEMEDELERIQALSEQDEEYLKIKEKIQADLANIQRYNP